MAEVAATSTLILGEAIEDVATFEAEVMGLEAAGADLPQHITGNPTIIISLGNIMGNTEIKALDSG